MSENYYTIEELAVKLKVDDVTIRRLIKAGQLKTVRVGRQHRITEEEFRAFEKKNTQPK